jgi:hypothetical protein
VSTETIHLTTTGTDDEPSGFGNTWEIVSVSPTETTDCTDPKILDLTISLGFMSDINRCHRIGTKNNPTKPEI